MVVILGAGRLFGSDRLLGREVFHQSLPRRSTVRNNGAAVLRNKLILATLAEEIHRRFHLGVAYYLWRWWRNVDEFASNGWMRDLCCGHAHVRLRDVWILAGFRLVYRVNNKCVIVGRPFWSESVQILLVDQARLHAQRVFYAALRWHILDSRTHRGDRQRSHLTLLVEDGFRKFDLFEIVIAWDPLLDLPNLIRTHHPTFVFPGTVYLLQLIRRLLLLLERGDDLLLLTHDLLM